jgi:glycosyltransferase involved in cell wall biosynthesis
MLDNKKKKVLIFSNLYPPAIVGGAEKIVKYLAEGLLQTEYEPVVVTTAVRDILGANFGFNIIDGVKLYSIGLENCYYPFFYKDEPSHISKFFWHLRDIENFKMAARMEEIIAMEEPDVICTHNLAGFSDVIWKIAKQQGISLVHVLHDYYQLCPKATMFKNGKACAKQCLICKLFSMRKKYLSSKVDAVVGVSDFILQKHLQEGYFKNASIKKVIFNAIVPEEDDILLPKQRGVDKLRIGYIGRIEPAKGVEILLQAMRKLPSEQVELYIAGKAKEEYLEYLQKQYSSTNVNYLGFVRPAEFYANIDCLVVPSLWGEPLATVIIEAFMHSIPVVGSRIGGIVELIDDELNGFLFTPGGVDELQGAIMRFIDDSSLLVKFQNNMMNKRTLFSQKIFIKEYVRLFNALG